MTKNRFKSKKAIFFDFGDTLASTIPSYPERIGSAIKKAGFEFNDDDYIRAYMMADYHTYKRYKSLDTVDNDKRLEWMFEIITNELSLDTEPRELRKEVRSGMRHMPFERRILLNGANETLSLLKNKGYRLAILSNNDGRVHEKCAELGIRNFFEAIIDSTNVGYIKPDRQIFDYTLDLLGLNESESIHIGDLYGADVLGANNANIDAIWFNHRRSEDLDNKGVTQIDHLSQLEDIFL